MRKLIASDANFNAQLSQLLENREESQDSVAGVVRDVIASVRREGDKRLMELTQQFDRFELRQVQLDKQIWQQEAAKCPPAVTEALSLAAERIAQYSKRQLPEDAHYTDATGVELGWRWLPVDSAGLYVPGGLASYPSSVLMNAIPAKIAGVERLVVTVPLPDGKINPAVLKACDIAGVNEIYTIGGAQAIAALAYGTESIAAVDVIVGPGNAYVAEAKRQVFGRVGIDMIAGPSEVLIVTDNHTPPRWIAMDMLAQAEHDARAQSIVITDDLAQAGAIEQAVEEALRSLPRAEVASQSIQRYGAIIVVEDVMLQSAAIINRIAPEHLQLAVKRPELLAQQVRHAGAIFLGALTTEAMGDYIAGPSHVLPTNGTARYASGLSVFNFLRRSSWIKTDAAAFSQLAGSAIALADEEGLDAHASSMRVRMEQSHG